jgi:hypothetical protein
LTAQQLRDEWRRLYRGQPPRLSRDLLIRTIAYRMQELVYGGLSKATQRKLDALAKDLKVKGSIVVTPDKSLRPGTRLVREWRGKTHTVVVTENGFEYAGKTFPSLTKIAHAVTGAAGSQCQQRPGDRCGLRCNRARAARRTFRQPRALVHRPARATRHPSGTPHDSHHIR